MSTYRLLVGDARFQLGLLPDESVQCAVTSPPYWGLRDYGVEDQIGLESTPEKYVEHLIAVFREVRRVLKPDGVLWLNLGDSYATGGGAVGRCPGGGDQGARFLRQGHINTQPNRMPIPGLKPKDLVGIPWRVAFALQADGWWLRSDNIWHKPNPMPESVQDRTTKAHEYVFLLTKSEAYFYDGAAVAEPAVSTRGSGNGFKRDERLSFDGRVSDEPWQPSETRNRRSVWTIPARSYEGAHFATFPEEIPRICILAGSRPGDTVLDPFNGAATTGVVALKNGRHYVGCELNPAYVVMSRERLRDVAPMFVQEVA